MSYLYKAFGWVLDLCYKIVPNYLVAILLFALIIKIVMFPLGIKQQKNSQKQARLRPKELAIRKKYAGRNDKATQQKAQHNGAVPEGKLQYVRRLSAAAHTVSDNHRAV